MLSTKRGIVGVRAADGAVRWEALGSDSADLVAKDAEAAVKAQQALVAVPWQPKTAQVPSPLDLGGGRLLATTGYGVGSIALEIGPGQTPWVKVLYSLAGKSKGEAEAADPEQGVFETDCHTPLLYQGHLYAVDHAVSNKGFFTCLKPDGTILWRHKDVALGLGTSLLADGLIFLEEGNTGTLHLIAADPAGYRELGVKQLELGSDSWGPMAYANGKLVVRGMTKLVCLQVGD
jgi:outer membrane protein assembly factor BamB